MGDEVWRDVTIILNHQTERKFVLQLPVCKGHTVYTVGLGRFANPKDGSRFNPNEVKPMTAFFHCVVNDGFEHKGWAEVTFQD